MRLKTNAKKHREFQFPTRLGGRNCLASLLLLSFNELLNGIVGK